MNDFGYVVAAFSVVWIGLLIYVFALVRREKQLRREIENLKEILNSQQPE